ncbi:enoyl-CoA hydratase [Roseobacter sp. SK209-2-6]|uniref:crotonase/enoyl-CoA hydratase family protein n=1 Tax=Roseobacter sp. SK209-2-6 TaxID=388739 RepID=UPI0000F3C559|nr:crotonase/enoyl-CoA hydratase family protein [Roseobacter sp. SK209-2-6]EBA18679.1 enoyl-CoA hydratase [Roseobacter sp. SK209-2-6]
MGDLIEKGQSDDTLVRQETADGVTTITICRPARRNAVDPVTAKALYAAFLCFEANKEAQAAVLTGEGGFFCSGFDLKSAGSGASDEWLAGLEIEADWRDPVTDPRPGPMGPTRLMLSKPVIAAIEGPAVAGGMELAAWCDMRVMAEDALAGVYCRRWGVPLIDGGTVRLPQILGQGRANDLILTGRSLPAEEAYRIGFADRLCPSGEALEMAQAIAHELTRFPQGCLRADHLSARMPSMELSAALRREWRSAKTFIAEGRAGAKRFADGLGRSGDFSRI